MIGRTRAAASLWAGLVAANQQLEAQGGLQPATYAAKARVAFNDISAGNSGAFEAGPGWDATTEFGSPMASKLILLLTGTKSVSKSPCKTSGELIKRVSRVVKGKKAVKSA